MLSAVKLKHLENFINSSSNLYIKEDLDPVKSTIKNIEDEKLLLKIINRKLSFSENLIGIYYENLKWIEVLGLSGYMNDGRASAFTFTVSKKLYNEYKKQLRIKKLNNINKDVI